MTTECQEVADAMPVQQFSSMDDARVYVRSTMPDESEQIIDNVTAALYARCKISNGQSPRAETDSKFEDFLRGYIVCALWSSIDEQPDGNGGPPMDGNYGREDLAPETEQDMRDDALAFYTANLPALTEYAQRMEHVRHRGEGSAWDYAGHDLWLTRNRHGAGYWDRGLDALGDTLADAARLEGSKDLYTHGGKVYQS